MNSNTLNKVIEDYKDKKINLFEFLGKLPDEKERLFETAIVHLILETDSIENQLSQILENEKENLKIRYNAFFGLCTYYRRRKDTSKYGELLERYKYSFSENPTYNYLKSMFLMQHGRDEDIEEAIILAGKAIRDIPNNVGISHCYSEIIAEAFEEGVLDIERNRTELDHATSILKNVLKETSDYAKFYCTYGRLLAADGKYKDAKKEILTAIDKEDSSRNDYALRIGDYEKYLIQITAKSYSDKAMLEFDGYIKKMDGWSRDVKESMIKSEENMHSSIQGSLNRNLEFLGFFAALVSFTIASVQILTKTSFKEAFELILELGGVLIIVMGSFGIILNGNKYIKRSIVVFIMGIICIALAIVVYKFY